MGRAFHRRRASRMSGTEGQVLDELARLRPAEILIPEHATGQPHEIGKKIESLGIRAITARPGWQFTPHHAHEQLQRQWQLTTTEGLGFADDDPATFAAAALLSYLEETQKTTLAHIRPPRRHVVEDHLSIDPASYRSLEIDRTVRSGGTEGSLLERHRPHAHRHGRAIAAPVAALSAVRHRAHRRQAVRRRGAARIAGSAAFDRRGDDRRVRHRARDRSRRRSAAPIPAIWRRWRSVCARCRT